MDNAPIHTSNEVKKVMENANHTYIRLPPYTPYLNASEWAFGFIKTHVQSQDL